jgi:hypothetical protein
MSCEGGLDARAWGKSESLVSHHNSKLFLIYENKSNLLLAIIITKVNAHMNCM